MSVDKEKEYRYSIISYICATVITTLLYLIAGHFFRFYYDLNDDVLIKDILSGAYTGSPDAHNIQMLYPLAWIFKVLYGIHPNVPWFGMLEIGMMWLCIILLLGRTQFLLMCNIERRVWRILAIIGLYICETAYGVGTQFWEFFMIQYTVVCGMMVTTAAFLLFTGRNFDIYENVIPIVLLLLAFNLRSEMFLLFCPFLAVVIISRWISEGFDVDTNKRNIIFIAVVACGLIISLIINSAAYRSDDWKEFNRLFKARTTVYDFTGIPSYEDNQTLYDSLHMDKDDHDRLEDYNYVLTYAANASSMEKIAQYASEHNLKKKTAGYAVFEVLLDMIRWKTPSQKEALTDHESVFLEEGAKLHIPGNMIIIVLYILAVIAAIYAKDIKWAYTLPFFLLVRIVDWGYISYKDRINARVAHPLYLMECAMLVGVLLVAWAESNYSSQTVRKRISVLLAVVFVISGLINTLFMPSSIHDVRDKSALREQKNLLADALYNYTSENPRTYYLIDVYSTVDFTEQIFGDDEHKKGNTQLAGGWAALSPLDTYKQSYYQDTDEWMFITAFENEDVKPADEIKNENEDTLFYVYYVKDIR